MSAPSSRHTKRARVDAGPAASQANHTRVSAAYSEDKGSRPTMEGEWWAGLPTARVAQITATSINHNVADVAVIALDTHGSDGPAAAGGAGSPAPPAARLAFVGVFDGHGGRKVAEYAAEHLHANVLAAGLAAEARRVAAAAAATTAALAASAAPAAPVAPAASAGGRGSGEGGGAAAPPPEPQQQPALPQPLPSVKACKAAILEGFRASDAAILERCAGPEAWPDGCTVVAAWVVGELVLVANVGDARGVLARRQQQVAAGGGSSGGSTSDGGGGSGGCGGSGLFDGGGGGAGGGEGHKKGAPLLKAIILTREHKVNAGAGGGWGGWVVAA